ncbi:hypothetical protein lerEdw1_003690 [Lerista edwardsae]|nr:hypothetical protein lerEdw1_003690 [Lerista edwardsae]
MKAGQRSASSTHWADIRAKYSMPFQAGVSDSRLPAFSDLSAMFWLPVLGLFVIWCRGSSSQPTLSQPASASVSPGNTVKLACAMSSGSSIGGYTVYWYQQKLGNPPRFLFYYYSASDTHYGSGVPSRFSGSKDSSSNTGHLSIAGALAEDEADYSCSVWDNSRQQHTVTQTKGEVRQKPPPLKASSATFCLGSGVPSRFSGSKDSSSNTGHLSIAGALAEDEADYYCAVWPSGACHSDAP